MSYKNNIINSEEAYRLKTSELIPQGGNDKPKPQKRKSYRDVLTSSTQEIIISPAHRIKINRNDIFKQLIDNQIDSVPYQWKLGVNDMKRISKHIETSIFDNSVCCLWTGYITNVNNKMKGTYINFYFKNKKVALHRLLYSNFISPLNQNEYIKFSCDNKGTCCTLGHFEKYTYIKRSTQTDQNKKKSNDQQLSIMIDNKDDLIVDFS